jgi:hypothetical protein
MHVRTVPHLCHRAQPPGLSLHGPYTVYTSADLYCACAARACPIIIPQTYAMCVLALSTLMLTRLRLPLHAYCTLHRSMHFSHASPPLHHTPESATRPSAIILRAVFPLASITLIRSSSHNASRPDQKVRLCVVPLRSNDLGSPMLRTNPASSPPLSSSSASVCELSILLHEPTPLHTSPSPALPRLARPPTLHPMRAAWCTFVLFHTLRHREPRGLSPHGTSLWFSLSTLPTVSSLSQSFLLTQHLHTHATPLLVSLAHSSIVSFTYLTPPPPRSIYSRPRSFHLPVPLPPL